MIGHRLIIDIETASLAELPAVGADCYAEDMTTRVLCLAYQYDDDPIRGWAPAQPPIRWDAPFDYIAPDVTVVAHNAAFEIAVWTHILCKKLHWPPCPPLHQWSCTMARAQYHGLPAGLEDVALALHFPPHLQKDAAGRRIMMQLAKPRDVNPLRWWHEDDPLKFQALREYCKRDVLVEAKLDHVLPELPPREAELWRINQAMNTEGVCLDQDLIRRLRTIVQSEMNRLNGELFTIAKGEITSVNQVTAIRNFLLKESGLDLSVLDKNTVAHVLATDPFLDRRSERILEIRAEAAKTSTAKLNAMLRSVSDDGQARGLFRYYGANRTGRYSSQRIQLQNMARPSIGDPNRVIGVIKAPGTPLDGLTALWGDTMLGIVASCLRGCIVAREGYLLPVADLSQIEARVIAWLAGQADILDVFAAGRDVYTWTANNVGSSNRQLGKVMVLALGFGMGAGKFRDTAAKYDILMAPDTAQMLVNDWRAANADIVQFWWDLEAAALRVAAKADGYQEQAGRIWLEKRRQAMVMRLPSGRELFYQRVASEWVEIKTKMLDAAGEPIIKKKLAVTYEGVNQYTRRWERLRAWAGRLAENATQAVARDVLTDALRQLNKMGLRVIGTVHDELIAEVPAPDADRWLVCMLDIMRQSPRWANSLPVGAEGKVLARYGK